MNLTFWAATDVGKTRDHNEDNFLVDKKLSLFVVADGMGGHASGEVASHLCVHEFRNVVDSGKSLIESYAKGDKDTVPQEILALLENAVQTACNAIYNKGQAEPEKRGMGTTCSALLIAGDRGFIAHVGDSRIYLVRQGQVVQLTEDHSLINELIRRGKVTKETINDSPYKQFKNAVTRAVGVYESVQADTIDFDVLPGDQFLLCSDGLHAYLDDDTTMKLVDSTDVTEVPKRFIDLANDGGGHDNITAIVVRMEQVAGAAADERSAELMRKIEVLKQMPLFRYLTYKEIIRVLNLTDVRDYAAGEILIKEGTPGDEMYILLKGKVRLHKDNAFITNLGPGAHMGEMALVDRSPRSASATAEDSTRALILRRREFYEVLRKDPALSVKLLWSFVQVLNERLRKTTADLSGARLEASAQDMTEDVLFEDETSKAS